MGFVFRAGYFFCLSHVLFRLYFSVLSYSFSVSMMQSYNLEKFCQAIFSIIFRQVG